MAFTKNDSRINRDGRPKGSGNSSTALIKESFKTLIENNLDKIQADLDSLKPFERVKLLLELATYVLPKQRAVEIKDNHSEDFKTITFDFDYGD